MKYELVAMKDLLKNLIQTNMATVVQDDKDGNVRKLMTVNAVISVENRARMNYAPNVSCGNRVHTVLVGTSQAQILAI